LSCRERLTPTEDIIGAVIIITRRVTVSASIIKDPVTAITTIVHISITGVMTGMTIPVMTVSIIMIGAIAIKC